MAVRSSSNSPTRRCASSCGQATSTRAKRHLPSDVTAPLQAIVALARDPSRQRWNQQSVTSGQLAAEYGFTDIDGSRPDVWGYNAAVEAGLDVDPAAYR